MPTRTKRLRFVSYVIGSGKTTLLNALSGRTSLSGGRVEVNGVSLSKRLKRKSATSNRQMSSSLTSLSERHLE